MERCLFSLDTLVSGPTFSGITVMMHETKITILSAMAQRLGADEVRIRQGTVIDDVGMTAHRA